MSYIEVSRGDILKNMEELKLQGMVESFDEVVSDIIRRKASFLYGLQELLKAEVKSKKIRSINYRMELANFPGKYEMDKFIFADTPISQEKVLGLYSVEFINISRNAVFIGGTGTGKTHMAIAIGRKAVRDGRKVRFFNLVDLANRLENENIGGNAGKLVEQLKKIDLLILDELGYLPFSKNGGRLLFHLLSKLHGKVSVIITTNLIFSGWSEVFNDKKMCNALLDRFTHQCEIIETGNESYRMKNRA